MHNVFYREPLAVYPTAVRAEGVYLYDAAGNQYLDGSSGAAVSCLGHGHPRVIAAIKAQLEQMAFAHTTFFTNEPQEKLAHELATRFGEPDAKVYFLAGGSEANETAIKLARQYWLASGKPDKHLMISRRQSYHGNTLGALSLSGSWRAQKYAPLLRDWPKIDPCYAFRHREPDESLEDYAQRSADSLEQAVQKYGADSIAAFFAETVVGATLGAVPAERAYFQRIREICDQHEILLVLDEVMSGSGRTGTYFAFEQEPIRPDIVTMAKGLAGGYQPLGAAIVRDSIHERVVAASGAFDHGHTYVGHATACAAGLAVLDVLDDEHLLDKLEASGLALMARLAETFADHPHVGDVRGRGHFIGVELVRDRVTGEPPPAGAALATVVRNAAMANGLICYPAGGTADGIDGAHVLLAPAFTFDSGHFDELVDKLAKTLGQITID